MCVDDCLAVDDASQMVDVILDNARLRLVARTAAPGAVEPIDEVLAHVPLLMAEVRQFRETAILVMQSASPPVDAIAPPPPPDRTSTSSTSSATIAWQAAAAEPAAASWLFIADNEVVARRALKTLASRGAVRFDFAQEYELVMDPIGSGLTADVYRATSRRGGFGVAAKVPHQRDHVAPAAMVQEVARLAAVQGHRNIVRFHGVFALANRAEADEEPRYCMIMELCTRSLRDALQCKLYLEAGSRPIMRDILAGLAHIHALGIVHRDVKPDNVMLRPNGMAILADFGLACFLTDEEAMSRRCGTPGFCPPEMVSGEAKSAKLDVWSAGSTLYFMLSGRQPFHGVDIKVTLLKTLECELSFEYPAISDVSDACKEYMRALLARSPARRPDVAEAWGHPWTQQDMQVALPRASLSLPARDPVLRIPERTACSWTPKSPWSRTSAVKRLRVVGGSDVPSSSSLKRNSDEPSSDAASTDGVQFSSVVASTWASSRSGAVDESLNGDDPASPTSSRPSRSTSTGLSSIMRLSFSSIGSFTRIGRRGQGPHPQ